MIMIRCGTCTSIFVVGDPRGVQCCSTYGDSFLQVYMNNLSMYVASQFNLFACLQLKKVRLRTTFASEDTCKSSVKVSCCEHYGNVLYKYSDMELRAVRFVHAAQNN